MGEGETATELQAGGHRTPARWSPASDFEAPEALEALRRRDEAVFMALFERYYGAMVRLARPWVGDEDAAAEVVQDAWVGIVKGIDRFEGRSALRTWMFQIVLNRARAHGRRARRSVSLEEAGLDETGQDTSAQWFLQPPDPGAGHWATPVRAWETNPETRALDHELGDRIRKAIDGLPSAQQIVVTLRDVEGWSASEVSELLEITEGHQRVVLHRARTRVRSALAGYLERPR